MLPAGVQPAARDPDGLQADESTVVFAERLRFAWSLRRVACGVDLATGHVLDLCDEAAREGWRGTLAVLAHARTLRLTGWTDTAGVWRRE